MSINIDSLDNILKTNKIPLFKKDGGKHDEELFTIEVATTKNNRFRRNFPFFYHYFSNFNDNKAN